MARRRKAAPRKGRKLSRFDLSRRGEIVLAVVGALLLLGLAALLWMVFSPRLLGESDERRALREKEAARAEALWREALASGLVVKADEAREEIVVSPEAWEALLPPRRRSYAQAAAVRHGWSRCFVRDGKTGRILAWTDREGELHTPRPGPEGPP